MSKHDKIIRLRRRGHKHYPVYDIVVSLRNKHSKGGALARIGYFNPNIKERCLALDFYALGSWLNKGVILHTTFKKLLSNFVIRAK